MASKAFERPASNFFRSHHISEEAIGGEHNAEVVSAARINLHFGHRRHHLLVRRSFLPAAPLSNLRERNERVKNRRTVFVWVGSCHAMAIMAASEKQAALST